MKKFPNYARSSHPDVIAAVEKCHKEYTEFRNQCVELTAKYTKDGSGCWIIGNWARGAVFAGIREGDVEDVSALPGRWKKRDSSGIIVPFKSNPLAKEFNLRYNETDIPGRGNVLWGLGYMGTGQLFVHDGHLYSSVSFELPDLSEKDQAAAVEFGWEEILASDFHKAHEAWNAEEDAKGAE